MRLPNIRSLLPPFRRRVDAQLVGRHTTTKSLRSSLSKSSDEDRGPDSSRAAIHTHSSSGPSSQQSFSSHSPLPESSSDAVGVVTTPLLLEGEELCLSSDGYARTFYQMCTTSPNEHIPIAIEEVYHLKTAHKRFLLRQAIPSSTIACVTTLPSKFIAPLGTLLAQVDLQEVDSYHNSSVSDQPVGTGGTTWEASLVMGMYFAGHPNELSGHVLELGSGLGLGGILVYLAPQWNDQSFAGVVESITLTDCSDAVLRRCQRNLVDIMGSFPSAMPMSVRKLDWNHVSRFDDASGCGRFDTVLACDCVFRHDDVPVLARALQSLLDDTPWAKIHLFSPCNRTPLSDMVDQLKHLGLEVKVEHVKMNRYRLKPESRDRCCHHTAAIPSRRDPTLQECYFASKAVATFAHITATHNLSTASCNSMTDVD